LVRIQQGASSVRASDPSQKQELGHRIARLRLERNLTTLERLEAGAAATQLLLFLPVLRQLDLLERLGLLLPEPKPSPITPLRQQEGDRKRASRRPPPKPTAPWRWGQP
jgi:hypothetical protein